MAKEKSANSKKKNNSLLRGSFKNSKINSPITFIFLFLCVFLLITSNLDFTFYSVLPGSESKINLQSMENDLFGLHQLSELVALDSKGASLIKNPLPTFSDLLEIEESNINFGESISSVRATTSSGGSSYNRGSSSSGSSQNSLPSPILEGGSNIGESIPSSQNYYQFFLPSNPSDVEFIYINPCDLEYFSNLFFPQLGTLNPNLPPTNLVCESVNLNETNTTSIDPFLNESNSSVLGNSLLGVILPSNIGSNDDDDVSSDLGSNDDVSSDLGSNDDDVSSDLGSNDDVSSDLGSNDDVSSDLGSNDDVSSDLGSNDDVSSDLGSNDDVSSDLGSNDDVSSDLGSNDDVSSDLGSNDDDVSSDSGSNDDVSSDSGSNDDVSSDSGSNDENN